MKKILYIWLVLFAFHISNLNAQNSKDKERIDEQNTKSILDRAGGTHDVSNIGLFFENRGKLYPRTITWGPSGEYPINSGKHYIYRINQYVGIPGNVIQSRFTNNEEWEAIGGFHNSDTARIAFSDDPNSWNSEKGWPIKDSEGNDLFISDQDSYSAFSDSGNTVKILGLQMNQTGYVFGSNFAKNIIFFKFEITNNSQNIYDSLYFGLHSDIDVGDASGGLPEYADDKVDFIVDKNLVYFYDDGITSEWSDGKTGYFGIMFLKTPEINGNQLGLTDFHYMLYNDDEISDFDSVQYGFMSSSTSLYNSSIGNKYFHVSNSSNIHFDDPSQVPSSGMDLLAHLSSGPYTINPGDTLVYYTAIVAGENFDELNNYADVAKNAVDANFNLPKPPSRPTLSGTASDFKATLYWNDISETSYDKFSGYDFEGYRLYRSKDNGLTWTQIADFDLVNSEGENTGLQYSYIDTTIVNGFEYWYSVTAYDKGNSNIESLESPIGNTLDAINTISIIPRSEAIGRTAVSVSNIQNLNTGNTNYNLEVFVVDNELLASNEYTTDFTFISRKESGDLATEVNIIINDTTLTKPYKYSLTFTSESTFDLKNETIDSVYRSGYNYPFGGRTLNISSDGIKIEMIDLDETADEFRPENGDVITINFAMNVIKNNSEKIIENRPYSLNQLQTTTDGISLRLTPPEIIQNISRIGGTDNVEIEFEVIDENAILDNLYIISIEGNGESDGNGFVLLSVENTEIQLDTLYNGEIFSFDGIQGTISFSENSLPNAGNRFSLETIKPILPNILDSFSFGIANSSIDYSQEKSNMNKIKVVPNPYIVASLWEPEFGELRKEPLRQIQFINLPSECTIYIFTIDADLIKTINHSSTNGTEVWDLRTESGRELASGIYIYVVQAKDAEFKERFAIIK